MNTRCPQCGAELPPAEEWKQKLCPACLMKLGLSGAIPANVIPEEEGQAESTKPRRSLTVKWKWVGIAGSALVGLALVAIAVRHFTEQPDQPHVIRIRIDPAHDGDLVDFAVSPDGRALAYTVATERDTSLWVHRLDQVEGRELPGTEEAVMPFWSPDSRSIGFFAGGKLKTIPFDGSPPRHVANAANPSGGTWNADGVILFASRTDGLQRVASSGGEVTRAIPPGPESLPYAWPHFLPDGIHFLFSSTAPNSVPEIRLGRLDSAETRKLVTGAYGGIYSNGRMLFVRDGFLMTQPLDLRRGDLTDQAISRYAERIGANDRERPYSAGGNVLAFRTGGASVEQELVWMDRIGKIIGRATEPAEQSSFSLSPDMTAVALTRRSEDPPGELWLFDLRRGTSTRLTFDHRGATNPLWAPDGRRIAFTSRVQSQTEVRSISANGTGAMEVLLKHPFDVVLESWSPDGKFLSFTTSERGKLRLSMLQLQGDRQATPFLQGDFNFKQGRFSPDGRAVAYVSDESGRDEVYVQSFPPGEIRLHVSTQGGTQPQWHRNGRELFYVAPGRQLMAVQIERSLRDVGAPQMLFQLPRHASAYEVTPDGNRFLVAVPVRDRQQSSVDLVLNWTSEN